MAAKLLPELFFKAGLRTEETWVSDRAIGGVIGLRRGSDVADP
jgi:hypothetical protein